MDIENKEYRHGLASYSIIGNTGNDGSDGNSFYYFDAVSSDISIYDISANDYMMFNDGYIYDSSKNKLGNILNYTLNIDDYYIDKHVHTNSYDYIVFNIDRKDCLKKENTTYELRNKYTNEIKTFEGYDNYNE